MPAGPASSNESELLLAVDVGNTNVSLGLYEIEMGTLEGFPNPPATTPSHPTKADLRGDPGLGKAELRQRAEHRKRTLRADWRLETRAGRSADEYAALLSELFRRAGLDLDQVGAVAISSVVPPALAPLERFCRKHLKVDPLIVGPGIKTGVPVLYENPREVGADRIVNAVAAYARWPQGAIVVDFGTATTFDVVTARGEYAGGVIAPGLAVSADALYQATAKLPRVEIVRPATAIGRNTVASMQAGLVFGYAGLVDAIVERIRAEIDYTPRVVGTGGLAPLIARESRTIEECDDMLTLEGLVILYERNAR